MYCPTHHISVCRRLLSLMFLASVFLPSVVLAHFQPTTMIFLDIGEEKVGVELQMPLSELELAFGHDVTKDSVEKWRGDFIEYLLSHIRPTSPSGAAWTVSVDDISVNETIQPQSGPFQEAVVHLEMTPPSGESLRQFTFDYDAIMHQVVTHKALVSIRRDWQRGQNGEDTIAAGVIQVDTVTTKISPLEIALESGSIWQGFTGMLTLGMQHIKDGTDHLLFLLVLLLPAPLLFAGGRWGEFGGTRYSVARLLKIVTAFTLGHSVTLLVGALGLVHLPQQPVEILIAVSILVSATHALRPIFPGKEMFVAAAFGLVHGLAFSTVLSELNLGAGQMAVSILGFNLGIELMQLIVIALVVPWLIIISLTPAYKFVRVGGACLAAIAAAGWIVERVSGSPNAVGTAAQGLSSYGHFVILFLAVVAIAAYYFSKGKWLSDGPPNYASEETNHE